MRILVAEDEKGVASFLRQGLREAGYAVDIAQDGGEALGLLETIEYDLIILDIMLPRVDGITLLRKARSLRIRVPILLLTAKAEIANRVSGLDAGPMTI